MKSYYNEDVLEAAPVVAICYDFDRTLSPRDMQEYGFIGRLGMTPDAFWAESESFVRDSNMDGILAYMYQMINAAKARGISVTKSDLNKLGEDIELFKGVKDWFGRINEIGKKRGVSVEHYIISSGIQEIIEGTEIAKYFTQIYASSFYYDDSGVAVWPAQAVNYTTKTQYIFRINKNISVGDVNVYIPDNERRIPFSNIIYLGDSATDIPAMKLVRSNGGKSIGVYDPASGDVKTVKKLIKEGRIDYYAPADYRDGGQLQYIIEQIFRQIRAATVLHKITKKQING